MRTDFYTRLLPKTRRTALAAAICLTAAIAAIDWAAGPKMSLGILYFLPVVLTAGPLRRREIVGYAIVCAGLRTALAPRSSVQDVPFELAISAAAYAGMGLLIREIDQHRRAAQKYAQSLTEELRLRREAEAGLLGLVEAIPAAVLTIDVTGRVAVANEAANILFACEGQPLTGRQIDSYLPELARLREVSGVRRLLRTMIEGTGYRHDREAFLAHIWVSSLNATPPSGVIAVIFDATEQLRHREEAGLYSLTNSARIIMGALWHETRNICSAMRVLVSTLAHQRDIGHAEEIEGLWSLVSGLEKVAYSELRPFSPEFEETASLRLALDHLRIVVGPSFGEEQISIKWNLAEKMPLVRADAHGLLQVFLNVVRNARAALQKATKKQVTITSLVSDDFIHVKFANSGPPVSEPEKLFKAMPSGGTVTGLGLYISRAMMRSFGGDLSYEPASDGCCFVVKLAISHVWYGLSRQSANENTYSAG